MNGFAQDLMNGLPPRKKAETKPNFYGMQLDSAAKIAQEGLSADDAAVSHYVASTSISGAAAIQQWADAGDDTPEGGKANALLDLIRGLVDGNNDDELDEDEQGAFEDVADAAWAYAASKGATDDDLDLVFNAEEDSADVEAAAQRIIDLLEAELPEGADANMDDLTNFAFSDEAGESQFDAAYRKRMVIRHGRKVKINKRISGSVHRSSKQKLAIQKAQRKSNTATSRARRVKSLKLNKRMGLSK